MQTLFDRLDLDPLDISTLIFAWKLQAKVPFEFSRAEFVNGCIQMQADSLEKLKKTIRTCPLTIHCDAVPAEAPPVTRC